MNFPARFVPLLVLGLLLATAGRAAEVPKLAAPEAARLVAAGEALLIDVREPAEWAETGVAAPALLLPTKDFEGKQNLWGPFLARHPVPEGKTLILYCHSGIRAGRISAALAARGYKVASAIGFRDWQAAGLPVRPVGGK